MRVLGDCETVKESRREIHRAKRRREAKSRRRRLAAKVANRQILAGRFSVELHQKLSNVFSPILFGGRFLSKPYPLFPRSTLQTPATSLFNQTMGFRNTNYTPNPAVDPVPEGLPYERTCSRYAKVRTLPPSPPPPLPPFHPLLPLYPLYAPSHPHRER